MSREQNTWLDVVDERVGRSIPIHPHILSVVKLVVVTPAIAVLIPTAHALPWAPVTVVVLFIAFVLLDALDGSVARARRIETQLGRVLDQITDVPLVLVVTYAAFQLRVDQSPAHELLFAKAALDVVVAALSIARGRPVDDRVRTVIGDIALFALMAYVVASVAQAPHPFVNRDVVNALLGVNIAFSAVVGLYNAGVLQKRFIADSLSGANALCGLASIYDGVEKHPEVCLGLLLVGAGFDGLDGAAARRWGGTRFGVFSDDIADCINYAIAPGVALACVLEGAGGVVVGVAYSVLTISRLVFFTLNKSSGADPAYFAGVPSTIGGIVDLCALILFRDDRAIVGLLVGVAVVLMVSFDSAYRHLGRALFGARRERVALAVVAGVVLIAGGFVLNPRVPIAIVLGLALLYGFLPQIARFKTVLAGKSVKESV